MTDSEWLLTLSIDMSEPRLPAHRTGPNGQHVWFSLAARSRDGNRLTGAERARFMACSFLDVLGWFATVSPVVWDPVPSAPASLEAQVEEAAAEARTAAVVELGHLIEPYRAGGLDNLEERMPEETSARVREILQVHFPNGVYAHGVNFGGGYAPGPEAA